MSEHSPMTNEVLLAELEPTVARLYEHHLSKSKEWFPHEFVPWSRGRDYEAGEEFDPSASSISAIARDALRLNLLTEDALPHYYKEISDEHGTDGAWGEWDRRWTAEEGRHAIVIRDYLAVTRSVDMRRLERERMKQVSGGKVPHPPTLADGIVYVTMQEKATRISHQNTGKLLDEAGQKIMNRVAADEGLHHLFYRDTVVEALKIDPVGVITAFARHSRSFNMPGEGIEDYQKLKRVLAVAGMFGKTELLNDIVLPLVRHLKIEKMENLPPAAERGRERLMKGVGTLGKIAIREQEEREAYQSSLAA